MTFGERLSMIRKEKRLTQSVVASALKTTQPKYNKWENDVNRPNFETVVSLAQYFGTTTDDLLGHDTKREKKEIKAIVIPFHIDVENVGELVSKLVRNGYVISYKKITRNPSGTESTVIQYWKEITPDERWPESLEGRD